MCKSGRGVPARVTRACCAPGPSRKSRNRADVALANSRFGIMICNVAVAAGAMLQPHWTREAYWGQWTPVLRQTFPYRGRVRSARLDELDLPGHRLPDGLGYRERLAGDFRIEVVVEKGEPPAAAMALIVASSAPA